MMPITNVFDGKDAKTKRRYNAIFSTGFKNGAKARFAAGIAEPPGKMPKRSAKIPTIYAKRDERILWASGYRMGYAVGTPILKRKKARL